MTWEQAGQICFDQVPLIARHLPLDYWRGQMDWPHRVQILFADKQRLKPEIDAAMREFSVSRDIIQDASRHTEFPDLLPV